MATETTGNNILSNAQWFANFYSPALIIDDDDLIQTLLQRQLQDLGLNDTECCTDGERALIYLASRPRIGLIILDLSMPKVDGVSLIKEIAGYQPNAKLLILSSQDEGVLRSVKILAESFGLHVLGALSKPLRNTVLRDILSAGFKYTGTKPLVFSDHPEESPPSKEQVLEAIDKVVVHLQPKINLRTETLVGFEALARMPLEIDGRSLTVFPDYFIPIFETAASMHKLTARIITQTLESLKRIHLICPEISASINLSMQDLELEGLVDFIQNELQEHGLLPRHIVLEVTETSLAKNLSLCMETVAKLRLMGCSVSIDDFGTGFSSFKQLRELPFDELKIDRTFVDAMANDKSANAIVDACQAIARAFNMRVVAEGIETREQHDLLVEKGCNQGQGYYYSPPLAEQAFLDWVASRQVTP